MLEAANRDRLALHIENKIGAAQAEPASRVGLIRALGVNDASHAFPMSKDRKFTRRGPFEGKKIRFASTEQIEALAQLTDEFMANIFDLEPGEYLITDESDLLDFADIGFADTSKIWSSIMEHYRIDRSDVGSERFVKIFSEIARRRKLQ